MWCECAHRDHVLLHILALVVFFYLLLSLLGTQQWALDQREGVEVDVMKRNQ